MSVLGNIIQGRGRAMSIRVWRGVLKIPIKIFYVGLLVIISLLLLGVHLLQLDETEHRTACVRQLAYESLSKWRERLDTKHAGCTHDPDKVRTTKTCPKCFRHTLAELSMNLTKISPLQHTFPRGPSGYFQPRGTKQQEIVHNVIISPSLVCVHACPYLLAVQLSVTDQVNERDTARLTWGSVAKTGLWPHAFVNAKFQILFVLAHQSKLSEQGNNQSEMVATAEELARIRTEANRHGDILYLDLVDSYFNLTLKLMSAFHWVQGHCPGTAFFLKVDADTFINVPLLLDLLLQNEHRLAFSLMGHIYTGERNVFRTGRWAVSKELYPINFFPIYASGCAYVISASALFTMTEVAPYIPMIPIEDAFTTGILARVARVQIYALDELFTHFKDFYWRRCQMVLGSKIAGTLAGGPRAMDIWAAIVDRNVTCFDEDYSYGYEKYYKLIVVE